MSSIKFDFTSGMSFPETVSRRTCQLHEFATPLVIHEVLFETFPGKENLLFPLNKSIPFLRNVRLITYSSGKKDILYTPMT